MVFKNECHIFMKNFALQFLIKFCWSEIWKKCLKSSENVKNILYYNIYVEKNKVLKKKLKVWNAKRE